MHSANCAQLIVGVLKDRGLFGQYKALSELAVATQKLLGRKKSKQLASIAAEGDECWSHLGLAI
jgi:hypothetical protein